MQFDDFIKLVSKMLILQLSPCLLSQSPGVKGSILTVCAKGGSR